MLHLAASSSNAQAYTFFSILLRNKDIAVNAQDAESGYTALHRALFAGNLKAARDLLQRHDIDVSVKDAEGLTAFDMYNGTVEGTNPPSGAEEGTDLYVWGVNRNFALGTGDSSDKAFPDRVNLLTQRQAAGKAEAIDRFFHVGIKEVSMAKLHTGAITTEAQGNLSLCGFGNNGRLGRSIHSQLALVPLPDLGQNIVSIALAQDHTLALTSAGYVLSWGHNRFSQLGFVVEAPDKPIPGTKDDPEVQMTPKRILGPLKKEFVRGVAAGRMSSACWTEDTVWTWGTNAGHLGYEKAANPVQVQPRKVTALTQPVLDVALSDYAMICLLDTFEVICFHHDVNFRISFTTPRPLLESFPFRPPQSTLRPMMKKVTSCGNNFAAVSSIGDVFTFSLPNPAEDVSKDARDRHVTVRPQLVWALRKGFTAVKDFAIGLDGTMILCTQSGHVYVRQRVKAGSGQLKFKRVPYLQRIIKVACNDAGAFAAIRIDAKPTPIPLTGRTLEDDMSSLQPHFRRFENQMTASDFEGDKRKIRHVDEDDDDDSVNSVHKDLIVAAQMCQILRRWKASDAESLFSWSEHLAGSDLKMVVGIYEIPVHSTILALRVPALGKLFSGAKISGFIKRGETIEVQACHPLVILLLLQYIYTDDVACLWDARVSRAIQDQYADLEIPHAQVKAELKRLSDTLDLQPLSSALESTSKFPISTKLLPRALSTYFASTSLSSSPPASCDVTIDLADKQVHCSSVILRSRCTFFEAMFDDQDWLVRRLSSESGRIRIDMSHLHWRPMRLVFRYIHEGVEDELFDYLHQENLDEFLDFVFEVLAAATELLLDRLVLVCSRVIIRHCSSYNAASLACEASFYQASTLKLSVFDYITASMETMLESGLLDDMYDDVLADLANVIASKQGSKLYVPRSGMLTRQAMDKHRDWLALQDIPTPRVRQPFKGRPRPSSPTTKKEKEIILSPGPSPLLRPANQANDDIFAMDDEEPLPTLPSTPGASTPRGMRPATPLGANTGGKVWRSKTADASDKVDLRSIMAEAASTKPRPTPGATPVRAAGQSGSQHSNAVSTPGRTPASARPPLTTPGSSTGSWRAVDARKTSLTAVQTQQAGSSSSPPSFIRGIAAQASPIPQRVGSSKTVTPVKLQAAPPGNVRKTSQGPAWTTTTGFAPPPVPMVGSPDSRAFSLLSIQQQERSFAENATRKPAVKSMAEIQAEEQRLAEERREEDRQKEFERWWAEEERRKAAEENKGKRGGRGGAARGGQVRKPPKGRGGAAGAAAVSASSSVSASAKNGPGPSGPQTPQKDKAASRKANGTSAPAGPGKAQSYAQSNGQAIASSGQIRPAKAEQSAPAMRAEAAEFKPTGR